MARLPDTTGLKSEWIARRMDRRRSAAGEEYVHHGYAQAVRGAGGRFVEVGDQQGVTLEQIEAAVGPGTAGVYWVAAQPPNTPTPEDVIALAHRWAVPVLIDASNTLPPPEHLHRFVDAGADLVAFSGGKGLRGPQGSGFLAGRADLIAAVRKQAAPTQGIGRVCKVSKEEIVGLLTALELWAAQDHRAAMRAAEKKTGWLYDQLGGLTNAEVEYVCPDHIGRPYPTVHVRLDPDGAMTAAELLKRLLGGSPPVAAMSGPDARTIRLDVRELSEPDVQRVADAVLAVLMPGSFGR
ncbi:MAG TPA: aminotransferase class V-fold PLP-dependent enzyme, partial [Chloroflexota bacterium]|jgi:L-seryl-tRNA(Ser) seleniumtransferase|nr:aminotransferase class V-fold PLP-dependent enzyme [Chloroflexota bacterium]